MRNQDEQRQYQIYQTAVHKRFYNPAAPASLNEIQQVKTELMSWQVYKMQRLGNSISPTAFSRSIGPPLQSDEKAIFHIAS